MLALHLLHFVLCTMYTVRGQNILMVALAYPGDVRTYLRVGDLLGQRGYNVTIVAHEHAIPDGKRDAKFSLVTFQSDSLQGQLKPGWIEGLIESILEGSWLRRIASVYEEHMGVETLCTNILNDKGLINNLAQRKFDFALVGNLPCTFYIRYLLSVPFACTDAIHDFSKWPSRPSTSIIPSKVSTLDTIWNLFLMKIGDLVAAVRDKGRTFHLHQNKQLLSSTNLALHCRAFFIFRSPFMDFAYSRNPSIIYLGEIPIPRPQELPLGVKSFVDISEKGAVVVAFGSRIVIPDYLTFVFLEAFAGLPYHFIMKSDMKNIKSVPENVLILPWLPLNDILSHPKSKLIICHGGMNTLHEATYHGVPSVIIPFVHDQPYNGIVAESKGFGKMLGVNNLSVAKIKETIEGVIKQDNFKRRAMEISSMMKDQPSSVDILDQWVKTFIKYDNKYFESAEPDYSICIDLYMIYIYTVIVIAIFLTCGVVIISCLFVFRMLFHKVKKD